MLLLIGSAAILPFVAVVIITVVRSRSIVSEESFRLAGETGHRYATVADSEFAHKLGIARSVSAISRGYRSIPPQARRNMISEQLRSILEANPGVMAVWTQWEPGAIGDDPSAYRGTDISVPDGSFVALWYRRDGKILRGKIGPQQYSDDYYTIPKRRMNEAVTNPYRYSYSFNPDETVLMTSICVPIIVDGVFKGVAGVDVSLDIYQKLIGKIKIFETGNTALVAGDGTIVSHVDPSRVGRIVGDGLSVERRTLLIRKIREKKEFSIDRPSVITGKMTRQFYFPVDTGVPEDVWFFVVVIPLSEITTPADSLALTIGLIGIAAIAILLGAILVTARYLSRPITALTAVAECVASGDLSVQTDIEGHDEISRLGRAFNTMTEKLKLKIDEYDLVNRDLGIRNEQLTRAEESLRALNADLEQRVRDKTAELQRALDMMSQANTELEQSLENLTAAQDRIVTTEKMAVLGRLIAGIAHELNTPLGAIRSSAGSVVSSNRYLIRSVPETFARLDERTLRLFEKLTAKGMDNIMRLSTPYMRRKKWKLSARLSELGIEGADGIADNTGVLDAFEYEDEIVECAVNGGRDVIAAAAEVIMAERAVNIIVEASAKAAGTVSALVDYSRTEDYDISGDVDPVKEIETILVLYYNRLKHSMTVIRNMQCNDHVTGERDRLNQVWINIINNALQAMNYEGTLTISTRRVGDDVAVSFSDTGPGIPGEIKDRIFEPFFSTKKCGEGTGLGLDICRKIIDKHNGRIDFTSGPGGTVFTVYLRARSNAGAEGV